MDIGLLSAVSSENFCFCLCLLKKNFDILHPADKILQSREIFLWQGKNVINSVTYIDFKENFWEFCYLSAKMLTCDEILKKICRNSTKEKIF